MIRLHSVNKLKAEFDDRPFITVSKVIVIEAISAGQTQWRYD